MMSRSVASDSEPRLIRSPANHSGVPSGGAALASNCWNGVRQPCRSPKASGSRCGSETAADPALNAAGEATVGAVEDVIGKSVQFDMRGYEQGGAGGAEAQICA